MKCETCKSNERIIRGLVSKLCFGCNKQFVTGGADYDNTICPKCAAERGICPVCSKTILKTPKAETLKLLDYFKTPEAVAMYLRIPKDELDVMVENFYAAYPSLSLKEMEAKYGTEIDAVDNPQKE